MIDSSSFLQVWYVAMIIGGILACSVGVIIFLVHNFRVSVIKDFKEKYDYANANEIKWYKWAFTAIGVGIGLFINLYGSDPANRLNTIGVWFFVRLFFGIAGATLVAYVSGLILEYYYPTRLNEKLKKWRYMPRINPKNGNKMRLLSEEEEDVHLDLGRQAEENIFSVDYDVWIDEKTNEVKIEKYQGHLTALRCNNCGFYTMRVVKEEVAQVNEDGSPKEILKHYRCSYCKNVRATAFIVSRKESEDYRDLKELSKQRNTRNVDMIRIEINSIISGKKFYEFPSVEQAKKFLENFDSDKSA